MLQLKYNLGGEGGGVSNLVVAGQVMVDVERQNTILSEIILMDVYK